MSARRPILETGATFSPCGSFRYTLTRTWDPRLGLCAFVCFNPSTADGFEDDPTVRRCIDYAQRWGFGSFVMLNLFAYRATDPNEIARQVDPVGPMNDEAIRRVAWSAARIVLGWGALAGPYPERVAAVRRALGGASFNAQPKALGVTRDGHPRHPLYLRADAEPELYEWATR